MITIPALEVVDRSNWMEFYIEGGIHIRMSPEGFFIDGRKVTDDKEVYRGFQIFLRNAQKEFAYKIFEDP